MLELTFWCIFLLTPIIIIILLRIYGKKVNQLGLISTCTVFLYFFSIIGTLPLFYQIDSYRVATGIVDQNIVTTVLFFSTINIIFFLFGAIIVRKAFLLNSYPFCSSSIRDISQNEKIAVFVTLIFSILTLYIYISKISGNLAIIALYNEGLAAAQIARSNMGNNFSGKYHWYSLVLHNVTNIIMLTYYVTWLINKKSINLFFFLVSFCISTFIAIMATEKAPIIYLLISLSIAYFFTRHHGYCSKNFFIKGTFFTLIILIPLYIFFMGVNSIEDAVLSILSRTFSGSIAPAYFYLEYFPTERDYLEGLTFPNPGGIMPFTPIRYTVEIMNWKFPELESSNIVGTMPTVFWGESYANFGSYGIPVIALLMGIMVAIIEYLISKLRPNPITIAYTTWLIIHFSQLSISGFSGFLYDFYIFFITMIVIILLFANRRIHLWHSK